MRWLILLLCLLAGCGSTTHIIKLNDIEIGLMMQKDARAIFTIELPNGDKALVGPEDGGWEFATNPKAQANDGKIDPDRWPRGYR